MSASVVCLGVCLGLCICTSQHGCVWRSHCLIQDHIIGTFGNKTKKTFLLVLLSKPILSLDVFIQAVNSNGIVKRLRSPKYFASDILKAIPMVK